MKFVKLIKAKWNVEKINENDWIIKSPDGTYKNQSGKDYHFKTKEDALEELDYLRAEHKFDKKSAEAENTFDEAQFALKDKATHDFFNLLEKAAASYVKIGFNKEDIMEALNEAVFRFEEDVDMWADWGL